MIGKRRFFRILLWVPFIILLNGCAKELTYTVDSTTDATNYVKVEKPDPEIVALIEPYKEKLDAKMNQVIGVSEKELIKGKSQSTLGNFIIDLILKKSIEYYGKPIDFALVTIGGLRTPIPKGEITVGNVYELMPFENELVVLTLKGSTVAKLLDHAIKVRNTQFAGLKYTTDGDQYSDVTINGKPFDKNATYTMSVSDYLASGGDHLDFLKEATATYQLGKTFRNAILEHIKDLTKGNKTINGEMDDRVIIDEN